MTSPGASRQLRSSGNDVTRPQSRTLASAAVGALRRFGLIDREFFDRLEHVRSRRSAEIRKVRALWLHNVNLDRGEKWAEGRYKLHSPLGRGGFGIVWRATDTRTGERVAIKILLENLADDHKIRRRFFRSASILAELDHPAIVQVRSSVEQEGLRFYYVMEFVAGGAGRVARRIAGRIAGGGRRRAAAVDGTRGRCPEDQGEN